MSFFDPAPEPPTALGRHRILSPTAGIRVSPLQLGAMSIGSAWEGFMGSMSKEQSFKLLDAFVAAGGNFIDTANNYQNEESETWIGEWMEERKNRDRMVIATKYTTHYRSYVDGQDAAIASSGNNKRSMHMSVRDSLKKLKTDFIDILYLHWWDWSTSIEEVMDSLHILVQQGKVLYLGRWNVMLRDFERDILPMARHFGMALAPWDALGGGRLQSKKALEERKAKGEGIRTMLGGPEQSEKEVKYSEVLDKIAQEHKVDSVTTIALAYVLSKTPYVFPIIGGRKVEHLHDNIKALTIKLTDAQIEEIENVEKFEPGFPHDFVGDDPAAHNGQPGGFMLRTIGTIDYVVKPKALGHE
ncbi:hypothetical protein P7C70_g2018, partial [Phenoliferia sp. Uapishka_3]